MNSKCVITGDTRGIGKTFKEHLESKGWQVIGFNTSTGLDGLVSAATGCDLFINNAYADGRQIKFLNELHTKVSKMIVCGSVAAFHPDPNMPVYSEHKKELAGRVREISDPSILMLHLSAKGYNNREALMKIIDLWLECSTFTEVFFDPTGSPNE